MKLLSISLFSFLLSSTAFGAACCGGGSAAPSIISGDDKALFSSSYSFTEVVIDNVDSRGIWSKRDDHQTVQTFKVEGAHLISDRWQTGISIPVLQRTYLNENHSGLGDVSVTLGYEYLPEWNYSRYRPKGIGFLQLTLPSGKSRAESELGGLDSRGNGFGALGAGTILTKVIGKYDLFSNIEVHRSFSKKFENSQSSGEIQPGVGGSFGVGAGYNLKYWRAGSSLVWNYEDPVNIAGDSPSEGSIERYATFALTGSYFIDSEWVGVMSFSDQTIFGSPVNTSLGRTIAFQIQKRWLR